MSTNENAVVLPNQHAPDFVLAWPEIAAAVFAARGFTSGWYRLGLRLQFAGLTAQLAPGDIVPDTEPPAIPAAIIGIDAVAVYQVQQGGDMVFDAGAGGAPVPKDAVLKKTASKKRSGSASPRRLKLNRNTDQKPS